MWILHWEMFAALLAVQHYLFCKQCHLWTLDCHLAGCAKMGLAMRRISQITMFQELITILWISANAFTIMALPVAVMHEWMGSGLIPRLEYLAVIMVCLPFIERCSSFSWNFWFSTTTLCMLGKAICEPFRDEIEEYYHSFSGPAMIIVSVVLCWVW